MINTSSAFKTALKNDNRNFSASCTITLGSGETLNISNDNLWSGGLKIEDATSNSGTFDVGAVIAQKLTLMLNNMYDEFTDYDFTDAVVSNVKISLILPSGETESVTKGIYTVTDADYDGDIITLECLDNIHKFDAGYARSNLTYPATLLQIVQDACSCCNMILATDSLKFEYYDYVVAQKSESVDFSFRDMLSYVGQISGHFWKCDAKGQLYAGWYGQADDVHTLGADVITDISTDLDDVIITGVRVITEDENSEQSTYLYGAEGYCIEINGNELVTITNASEIAAMIGNRTIGLRFRPLNASVLSDPTIEAGDQAILYDRKSKSYTTYFTDVTFSLGDDTQLSNDGESALRNSAERFSESAKAYQKLAKRLNKSKTEWEKAMDSLQNAMAEKEGLYPVVEELEDGSSILYFCDKKTLAESKVVVKLNAEGWGMSTDGGETWNIGALVDGAMITKILDTIGLNADWINTGAFTVKDAQGNVIFQADMDTKKVIISGDSVRIGKVSLTDQMTSMENAIALSRNMTMNLTNDYQTIVANSDGSIPPDSFPDVCTQAVVMYGSQDITDACSFSISTSEGMIGNWDEGEKEYTVLNVTEDNTWVDIKATYLGSLSVTKRFNVSKLRAAEDGNDGKDGQDSVLLYIESSNGTVFKNNSISTTLSVVIYCGSKRIVDAEGMKQEFGSSSYLQWKWKMPGDEDYIDIARDDYRINGDGFAFTITPDDVAMRATFICELIV